MIFLIRQQQNNGITTTTTTTNNNNNTFNDKLINHEITSRRITPNLRYLSPLTLKCEYDNRIVVFNKY
eukprot:UN08713